MMRKHNYTSSINFLYYRNFEKAIIFFEDVLRLELVMDQGFARVYKIAGDSFIGCVRKSEGSIDSSNKGGTLVSINTTNVEAEYQHVCKFKLPYLSEIKLIDKIPLKSFFFKDFEGYDFEIQEFLKKSDKELF